MPKLASHHQHQQSGADETLWQPWRSGLRPGAGRPASVAASGRCPRLGRAEAAPLHQGQRHVGIDREEREGDDPINTAAGRPRAARSVPAGVVPRREDTDEQADQAQDDERQISPLVRPASSRPAPARRRSRVVPAAGAWRRSRRRSDRGRPCEPRGTRSRPTRDDQRRQPEEDPAPADGLAGDPRPGRPTTPGRTQSGREVANICGGDSGRLRPMAVRDRRHGRRREALDESSGDEDRHRRAVRRR